MSHRSKRLLRSKRTLGYDGALAAAEVAEREWKQACVDGPPWVAATTGPFNVADIPSLHPGDRRQFVALYIQSHCTPVGRGRWLNVPRPKTTAPPRTDRIPTELWDEINARIAAMPIGTEFTSTDLLPLEYEWYAPTLTILGLRDNLLVWGPLLKRIKGRPSPVKVWTRGPAPMPSDPTALLGAWCAANPTRRTFGAADLATLVQPKFRPGMTQWLSEYYRTSGGTRGYCFTWHLDEQPLKVALGL